VTVVERFEEKVKLEKKKGMVVSVKGYVNE
jgi:hypothetical protein